MMRTNPLCKGDEDMDVSSVMNRLTREPVKTDCPGDYRENGLLHCAVCGEPKQARKQLPDGSGGFVERIVPISCACVRAKDEAVKEKDRREQFMASMQQMWAADQLQIPNCLRKTFDIDDRHAKNVSEVCRRYAAQWPKMKQENIGVLLFGAVGAGKSFYACAIANAVLAQLDSAVITSFPRILNLLQSTQDKQALLDRMQSYSLLVLDDLGAERDTAYAAEQVFNVVDARVQTGLPLIVTTNLSVAEMQQADSMQLKRIYDRVLELCPVRIKLEGESRRTQNAQQRLAVANDLLKPSART